MDKLVATKLDTFFEAFPRRSFKKHEILIQTDLEPQGILYLKNGVVRQYAISAQGEELTINIFRPLSFFPMSWAINNTVPHHYFEAMMAGYAYCAPRSEVMAFLKTNPDVLLDLISRVYKGLEGMVEHMEYLMAGSAYARLIVVLLVSAKRFGTVSLQDIKIELPMTHTELAAQAGMSRETVTREMKCLKDKGIAEMKANFITIHNLKALESEINR